jgi:hypothetical protein
MPQCTPTAVGRLTKSSCTYINNSKSNRRKYLIFYHVLNMLILDELNMLILDEYCCADPCISTGEPAGSYPPFDEGNPFWLTLK